MSDRWNVRIGATLTAVVLLIGVYRSGRAGAAEFFPRGDATCSIARSADDVVAAIRGLGGDSLCGNDDCDRDGAVSDADIDCTIGCLFATCPVPSHAPQVTTVAPDSAIGLVPFSTIVVGGSNLGAHDRLPLVTIGGLAAEIAGFVPEEGAGGGPIDRLRVALPDLPPGIFDVVVFDGDVAGGRFPVTVAAPQPIGAPDSFDDVADLLVRVTDAVLAFDLELAFGAEAAAFRNDLDEFRQLALDSVAAIESDPAVTPDLRGRFDAALDSAGTPDLLRALLDELQTPDADQGSGAGPANAAQVLGRTKRYSEVMRATGAVLRTSFGTFVIRTVASLAVGTAVVAGITIGGLRFFVDTPVITAIEPKFPIRLRSGMEITVRGRGLGGISGVPDLRVVAVPGGFDDTFAPVESGEGFLRFRLPDAPGFCGRTTLQLIRLPKASHVMPPREIEPEITLPIRTGNPGDRLDIEAHGMVGCQTAVRVAEPSGNGITELVSTVDQTAFFVTGTVPNLADSEYLVRGRVVAAGLESADPEPLRIESGIESLRVSCARLHLVLPPAPGERSTSCQVSPRPEIPGAPKGSCFHWLTSDTGVRFDDPASCVGDRVTVHAESATTTTVINAELRNATGDRQGALILSSVNSLNGVTLTVGDQSPPQVQISSTPPAGIVPPFSTIAVHVTAIDNDAGLSHIDLTTIGDAVFEGDRMQRAICGGGSTCMPPPFIVDLLATGFVDHEVVIRATARDASGNETLPDDARLVFTVEGGGLEGEIAVTVRNRDDRSPVAGASVLVLDSGSGLVAQAQSAGDGGAHFEDIPQGPVTVTATRAGFAFEKASVEVRAGMTSQVEILLSPLRDSGVTIFGTVQQQDPASVARADPAPDVTINVFDSGLDLVGIGLSAADGTYEVGGLPAEQPLLVHAVKREFALSSTSLPPSFPSTPVRRNFFLYQSNSECRSDLNEFTVTRGTNVVGSEIELGEAEVIDELRLNRFETHPDVAALCVLRPFRRPTIHWNVDWVEALSGQAVRFLDVEEKIDGGENAFRPIFRLRASDPAGLRPPLTYGDDSQGTVDDLGFPTPDIRRDGTPYQIRINGAVELRFHGGP